MRTVDIADGTTIAALLNDGVPHRVVCQLPDQIDRLRAYAGRTVHLKLELAAPPERALRDDEGDGDDEREQWDMAFNEALLRISHLSSLVLHFQGKASPDLFDELVGKVAHCLKSPVSLELSFRGAPAITQAAGMRELLSRHAGVRLVCRGRLACSQALMALTLGAPAPSHLTLSGLDPLDPNAIDGLSRLRSISGGVVIQCDDDTDPDLFIDALLQAGASSELNLAVHTPDGRSTTLQDRLDACRDLHLERLLQTCTRDGRLDFDELLRQCRSIRPAGPQLFAWACGIAMTDDTDEPPEVPMALRGYLRAVRHADVAHTVVCHLPADLLLLVADDLNRIVSLRLETGVLDIAGWRMLTQALRRMESLKSGSFCQALGTTYDLGAWVCARLGFTSIETLRLELPDDISPPGSQYINWLLNRPQFKSVICEGPSAAAQVLKSIPRQEVKPGISITVNLWPKDTGKVVNWLRGITVDGGEPFKVHIHVLDDQPPESLITALDDELRSATPGFRIHDLTVSSRSYRMPPDRSLGLSLTRQAILSAMQEVDRKMPRKPQGVDAIGVAGAFGASIGNGLYLTEKISARQAQILTHMGEPMKHLGGMLTPRDLMNLSSVNTRARRHIGNLSIRLHDGAVRWLQHEMARGLSPHNAQARLQLLLGPKVAQQVMDSYLDFMVRKLVLSVEKGDQLEALMSGMLSST